MTGQIYDPAFTPQNQPIPVLPVGTSYAKAVALTPGTPLPAGKGAIVTGSGPVKLKLSGGGTVTVYDPTAGQGTRFDGYEVVDADVSQAPGAAVQILY